MNVDKIFIKSFLHTFKDESFCVKFWDGDEVKVGENEPLFKIILKKPIPKKNIKTSLLRILKVFQRFFQI